MCLGVLEQTKVSRQAYFDGIKILDCAQTFLHGEVILVTFDSDSLGHVIKIHCQYILKIKAVVRV